MLERIPPIAAGEADPYGATRNTGVAARTPTTFRLLKSAGIPPSPPADLLHELDSAARAHEELHARGLNVAFDVQPDGSVKISLRDRSGTATHAFSAAEGLDALSGDVPIDEVVDR